MKLSIWKLNSKTALFMASYAPWNIENIIIYMIKSYLKNNKYLNICKILYKQYLKYTVHYIIWTTVRSINKRVL